MTSDLCVMVDVRYDVTFLDLRLPAHLATVSADIVRSEGTRPHVVLHVSDKTAFLLTTLKSKYA